MAYGGEIPLSYADATGVDFSQSMRKAGLTITETSQIFEVTRRTVYAWCNSQRLPHMAFYLLYKLDKALESGALPTRAEFNSKNDRIAAVKRIILK